MRLVYTVVSLEEMGELFMNAFATAGVDIAKELLKIFDEKTNLPSKKERQALLELEGYKEVKVYWTKIKD